MVIGFVSYIVKELRYGQNRIKKNPKNNNNNKKPWLTPATFFPGLAFFNCNITTATKLESIQDVFFL